MTKEEEIKDILSKEIAAEIDWEILSSMLLLQGWTAVTAKVNTKTDNDAEIVERWFAKNIKGKSRGHNEYWLFENEDDAVLFALRWV